MAMVRSVFICKTLMFSPLTFVTRGTRSPRLLLFITRVQGSVANSDAGKLHGLTPTNFCHDADPTSVSDVRSSRMKCKSRSASVRSPIDPT